MDYKGGTYEITVNGKNYFFHFGMNAQDLYVRNVPENAGTMSIIKYLFWAALMARQKQNDLKDDFSLAETGDLIDEMHLEDQQKLTEEAFKCLGFMQEMTLKLIPQMMMRVQAEE